MFSEQLRVFIQKYLSNNKLAISYIKRPLLIGLSLIVVCNNTQATTSSNDVYRKTLILERQIDRLRESIENTLEVELPNPQKNRLPVHVFAKSMEVREKISALQKRYNIEPLAPAVIPSADITPADVLSAVTSLIDGMSLVLQANQLETPSGRAMITGMTPNKVYEKLGLISNALTTIVGPVKPSAVYSKANHAVVGIKKIAQIYGVEEPTHSQVQKDAMPKDVNIAAFRNLYSLGKIQRELGIHTNQVAAFPIGIVSPANVYDTTNIILAELSRIRANLSIPHTTNEPVDSHNKTPGDILVLMQQFGQVSNLLLKKIQDE